MKQLAIRESGEVPTSSTGKESPAAAASQQEATRRTPNEHDFRTIKLISNGAYG